MDRIVVGVFLCFGLLLATGVAGATGEVNQHANDSAVLDATGGEPVDVKDIRLGEVGSAAPAPTEEVTVVGFNWPTECPDQEVGDLATYFNGNMSPADDDFHIDNGDGGAEAPPDGGCVLRTESGRDNPASIQSVPGEQAADLGYYPERGDAIEFNHYAHLISSIYDGADFQFRFGVQDADNYYYVSIQADNGPYELVLGAVTNGVDGQLATTEIGDTLTGKTYQPVRIDWGTGDQPDLIEATFAGTETVNATDTTFDSGGIGFERGGTQGLTRSYANLLDRVDATVVDPEFQLNITGVDVADDSVNVTTEVTNIGGLTHTENVTLSVEGDEVAGTPITLDSGYHDNWDSTETTLSFDPSAYSGVVTVDVCANESGNCDTMDVNLDPGDLQLASLNYPVAIGPEDNLTVDYTLENVGNETLTDSGVDLFVNGSVEDTDSNVTVAPGETANGTLTFPDSADEYGPGDSIGFTVALSEFDNAISGVTEVQNESSAILQLQSIDAPPAIPPDRDLNVDYTIANVGTENGTESFVDLLVNGTDATYEDTDEDVTVPAGETTSGTLTFTNVSEYFSDGDTIEFSVQLFNFNDTLNGSAVVDESAAPDLQLESIDAPETITPSDDLTVDYTIENLGDFEGTERSVDLLVDGTDASHDDTDENVTVPASGTTNGTLTFDNVSAYFGDGDTIEFSVELSEFNDTANGSTNVAASVDPDLQLQSIDSPATIAPTDDLTVEYTIENVGATEGTESFVDLLVEGTDSVVQDTDENVTVSAGGTTSGSLTFDAVDSFFADGDTIEFSVQLSDFEESLNGSTDVVNDTGVADIVIDSLDYPSTIAPTETLAVDYTLSNQGGIDGTESFVDLRVDGTDDVFDDTDEDVSVPAGETTSGTLTFGNVSTYFGDGDTIEFSVELWDFNDTANGSAVVSGDGGGTPDLQLQSIDYPDTVLPADDLSVAYTIENAGNATGVESAVELAVEGSTEDTDTDVAVPAGGTTSGTLTFDGVDSFEPGDTIGFTVTLSDFGDSASGTTTVEEASEGPDLALADVSADDEIAVTGDLTVEYTIENVGDQSGTESAVELSAGGTVRDTDANVAVGPGDSQTGTLTFDAVDSAFNPGDTISYTVELADFGDSASGTTDILETGEIHFELRPATVDVEPGAVQTYELVVEGPDSGLLAYQDVVVDITDPAAGTIVGFEEQFDDGNNTLSNSEIRNGGATLYLAAVTGSSFATPADEVTLATFDVEATGADGDATDLVFNGSSNHTVLDFETESPYNTSGFDGASMNIADSTPDLQFASVDAPDQIGVGDDLTVDYTVENLGDAVGTESAVTLLIDGTAEDTDTDVTVPAGGTETGSLTFTDVDGQYEGGDTIPYTVELSDFGDSASGTTTVTGVDPLFEVEIASADSISEGEDLDVVVNVSNVGGGEGTQTVALDVSGLGSDATQVTLASGDATEETLTVGTSTGDAGQYTATVSSENDTASTSVSVFGDSALAVSIVDAAGPVEGEDLTVAVELVNIGNETLTQTVTLDVPGLGSDDTQVTLEAGDTTEETMSIGTEVGDAGAYTATVTSADDSAEQDIAVYLPSMPGQDPPNDPDDDNLYEDLDGNDKFDIFDVQMLFTNFDTPQVQNHDWAYDFDGNGKVDIFDVQALFGEV